MTIRAIVVLLVGFALTPVHLAEAQEPTKIARIGYLSAIEPASESGRAEAIRLALRELGYRFLQMRDSPRQICSKNGELSGFTFTIGTEFRLPIISAEHNADKSSCHFGNARRSSILS